MPKKMNELELQRSFDSAATLFRRDVITETEFAQKSVDLAMHFFDELADVKPGFSSDELRILDSFVRTNPDDELLRKVAYRFIVDLNEPGIVERRMEELRPKFGKVVEYFTSLAR